MCKNLKYISLLQLRAMLAEPSKMHRNQPLAVYPATLATCAFASIITRDALNAFLESPAIIEMQSKEQVINIIN
jgi:hypothetical protein